MPLKSMQNMDVDEVMSIIMSTDQTNLRTGSMSMMVDSDLVAAVVLAQFHLHDPDKPTVVCPFCSGSGWRYPRDAHSDPVEGMKMANREYCHGCEGKGRAQRGDELYKPLLLWQCLIRVRTDAMAERREREERERINLRRRGRELMNRMAPSDRLAVRSFIDSEEDQS